MAKGSATWKRVKFGEVVRLNKETCKDPASAGIERVIGLEHLEPGDLRVRSWGDVAAGTTFTNRVRPGQVLFGKRRAYQRKVAVAEFDAICSGDIYVFESASRSKLLPELLPFICQTDAFFDYAVGTSAGSLSPRTNWTSLAEYDFSLPPLEEQKRFVTLLRAADDTAERYRDALTAAQVALARHELDLLLPLEVKLRNDSTLATVPTGWEALTLREMCIASSDLTIGPFGSNLLSSDYAGRASGVPVIFVRDIRPNRFKYLSNCFVSQEKAAELRAHHAQADDLVVTKVGVPESMGVPPGLAAVLSGDASQWVITADVIRARLNQSRVDPKYVARLLNTAWGRQQTWRISPGSTTRFKMNLGNFSAIRLPIPPLSLQRDALSVIEHLERAAESLAKRSVEVYSLVRRAFEGAA